MAHPGCLDQAMHSRRGAFALLCIDLATADYRRRRLRCSAEVRADGVAEWAGPLDARRRPGEKGTCSASTTCRIGRSRPPRLAAGDVVLDLPSRKGWPSAFSSLALAQSSPKGVCLQPVGLEVTITRGGMSCGWFLDSNARAAYELSFEDRGALDRESAAFFQTLLA